MRAHEFTKTSVEQGLEVDVPNENWLQDKIDYAQSKGRNRYGVPYMGATTAYTSQHQRVPVDILRRLPGMRGEQQNVRQQDLEAIIKIMKDTGKLPTMDNGKEYAPFINVAWNGEAWVNDGNHRIMAAAELGFKDLPVQISYFDGGERVKSGDMYPGRIGLGGIEENFADSVGQKLNEVDASAVQFRTASTDNYQSSFTVTAIADGKTVGHFSFFRDPETDDVHNQAEVTDDVRGKGYGKALLLKAIEVANDHGLGFQEDSQSLSRAQSRVYDSLYDAGWIVDADGYWFLTPEGEQELARLGTVQQGAVQENFADGKKPGRKGLAKRSGVNTKASVSSLRKTAKNSSGEKQRMAHWLANMKAGRAKAKRK
jgi:GNAT superfamily N-acetyltransferase